MTWLPILSGVVLALYGILVGLTLAAFFTISRLAQVLARTGGETAIKYLMDNSDARAPKWVTKLLGNWVIQWALRKAKQIIRNETVLYTRAWAVVGINCAILMLFLSVKYMALRADAALICLLLPGTAVFLSFWVIGLQVISAISEFLKSKMPEFIRMAEQPVQNSA